MVVIEQIGCIAGVVRGAEVSLSPGFQERLAWTGQVDVERTLIRGAACNVERRGAYSMIDWRECHRECRATARGDRCGYWLSDWKLRSVGARNADEYVRQRQCSAVGNSQRHRTSWHQTPGPEVESGLRMRKRADLIFDGYDGARRRSTAAKGAGSLRANKQVFIAGGIRDSFEDSKRFRCSGQVRLQVRPRNPTINRHVYELGNTGVVIRCREYSAVPVHGYATYATAADCGRIKHFGRCL